MTIKFSRETIRSCWEALSERLFPLHWEEFGTDKDFVPLAPNRELYFKMEDSRTLHLITLRDRNALMGYYIGWAQPGLHYQTSRQGTTDIFFVHPRYNDSLGTRGRLVGRLLDEAEVLMRDLGVVRWRVCEKVAHPLGPILTRRGLEPVEMHWSKLLR